MIYIYTLLDPITYEVRYVGQTKNYKTRYTSHIRESKLNSSYNGIKNPRAKKLYQYDIDNKLIKIWDYAKECADYYNISRGNISTFAKHNTNSDKFRILKGFVFKFN